MSPIQKSRIIFNTIADYFLTPMGSDLTNLLFKKSIYSLEGILICIFTYLWLEYAQMGKLYHWLFPIIFSSTIVFGHFFLTKLIHKSWRSLKTTIGKFWGISFVGICLSFIIVNFMGVCGILCLLTGSYCPTVWHTSAPKGFVVFLEIILVPWMISTFLLTQRILKKQIEKELISIKQINDALKRRNIPIKSEKDSTLNEKHPLNAETQKSPEDFLVQLKDGFKKILLDDIYFIAVEDHYCKLVFNHNGELRNELVRLSLKEALKNLPSNHFAHVHRSYVVNLQHVKKIKKEGQTYQLFIEGIDKFLPASRHRAYAFLPKLKEILG